jgi:hypothetical protein
MRQEIDKELFTLRCLIDKSDSDLCGPLWCTKTLGNDQPGKRCYMPEESNLQLHCSEKLKSRESDTRLRAGRTFYATDSSHSQKLFA